MTTGADDTLGAGAAAGRHRARNRRNVVPAKTIARSQGRRNAVALRIESRILPYRRDRLR